MGKIAIDTPQIRMASASDRRAALQQIFAGLPRIQRDHAVAESLRAIREAGPVRHEVLTAWRGEQMLGATWLEIRPGRVASVWPPGLAEGTDESVAKGLLDHAVARSRDAGALIVQSLAQSQDCREAHWLRASDFQHTTDVLCMDCDSNRFPRQLPLSELEFKPYDDADLSRWKAVLLASYEKSCDCPQMQKVRPIDDVLASYRAAGRFDSNHWLMARHHGHDVGCVLLTQHCNDDWELSYLGVIPSARGKGFGVRLVHRAQWLASRAGAPHLTLAVDVGNAPAIAVYLASGFETQQPSSVFSRVVNFSPSVLPTT